MQVDLGIDRFVSKLTILYKLQLSASATFQLGSFKLVTPPSNTEELDLWKFDQSEASQKQFEDKMPTNIVIFYSFNVSQLPT